MPRAEGEDRLLSDVFCDHVTDAYEHLYDIVYLRSQALMAELGQWGVQTRKEQAWELHHLLIETVESLDPGTDAPTLSKAWRRYRMLRLRYVEGQDIAAVCQELAISRRTFYRELKEALRAAAELLHDRRVSVGDGEDGPVPVSRLELVRLEATRASQASRFVPLREIVHDAHRLLQEMVANADCELEIDWASLPAPLMCDQVVLRQIVLGLVADLIGTGDAHRLRLSGAKTRLILAMEGGSPRSADKGEESAVDVLSELARSHGMAIEGLAPDHFASGYAVSLPTAARRTILVADDNEDTLHLLERSLEAGGYETILAGSGAEAERLAESVQPAAIIMDVMMPGQDGWDTLQSLLNRPTTTHIPVVICTVLAAKRLALSLGAAAFLPKPVGEGALLATLGQILDV